MTPQQIVARSVAAGIGVSALGTFAVTTGGFWGGVIIGAEAAGLIAAVWTWDLIEDTKRRERHTADPGQWRG